MRMQPEMQADKAEWIAEAVLRFLEGPDYRTPLLDFVDAQCLYFEDSDENKLEYTRVGLLDDERDGGDEGEIMTALIIAGVMKE